MLGASWLGTNRSSKPSLLKSPHSGLPHDLVGSRCNPATTETSVNCWANNVDAERAASPAAIASWTSFFLRLRGDEISGPTWGRQSTVVDEGVRPSVFILIAVALAYCKAVECGLLTAKCQRFSV